MDSIITHVYSNNQRLVLGQIEYLSQYPSVNYSGGHYVETVVDLTDSFKTAVALHRTIKLGTGTQTLVLTSGTAQTLNFTSPRNITLHYLLDSTTFKIFGDSTINTDASGTSSFHLSSDLVHPLDLPQENWSSSVQPGQGIAPGNGWYIDVNTKKLHCLNCVPFIIVATPLNSDPIMFFLVESDPEYIILSDKDGNELRVEYDVTSNEYVGDISSYALPRSTIEILVTPLMHSKLLLVNNKIVCTSENVAAKLQPYLPTSWDSLPTPADRGFDVIFDSDVISLLTDNNRNNILGTSNGVLRGTDSLKNEFYYLILGANVVWFGFNTTSPTQLSYLNALDDALNGRLPGADSTYIIQLIDSSVPIPS